MKDLKTILDNSLLLVESPSKIKIFEKYLHKISPTCVVLSSYGHIFNLLNKKHAIDVENNFQMTWEPTVQSKKAIPFILKAAKDAKQIIIATDPDREGEAIGWHIVNHLKQKKINKPVHRILFHALTQADIFNALSKPGNIRQDLVDAYFARLSLDFLVGFNISPLLWRKLPGCLSAGRVQSSALKNIVELEYKITKFKSQAYYNMHSVFVLYTDERPLTKTRGKSHTSTTLETKLISFPYAKIDGFCIYQSEQQVQYMLNACKSIKEYQISSIEKTSRAKHSPAPFITSTLQQEASSKLKLSPKQTMQVAQKLYEGLKINNDLIGLITYMRTDNVNMSTSAIEQCRIYIQKHFAKQLPAQSRYYKNNAKNTQEAHECIRPTDFNITPAQVKAMCSEKDYDLYRLYDLIWKRSVASQMSDALYQDQTIEISPTIITSAELASYSQQLKAHTYITPSEEFLQTDYKSETDDDSSTAEMHTHTDATIIFHAKQSVLIFDGWLVLYDAKTSTEAALKACKTHQIAQIDQISAEAKQTQPPSRYTAASLITRMDKLGIGRPGTYTNIIDILITREYITKTDGYLKPTQKSWFLIAFLEQYFHEYLKYEFTASMENTLDHIAQGELPWLPTMQKFWSTFSKEVDGAAKITYDNMRPFIEKIWNEYFFKDTAQCKKCQSAAMVRFWKGNGFLSCSTYPQCNWTASIEAMKTTQLSTDPQTQQPICIITDQYDNSYLQWSATESYIAMQVKIPTILKSQFTTEAFVLEKAMKLKAMPVLLGAHPDTTLPIVLAIGKFGPYIKYNEQFISVKSNPLVFTFEDAVKLIEKVSKYPKKK